VPYEVTFTKRVEIMDRGHYINECCVGGDAVVEHLLPAVERRYVAVRANQEDWGWFIWCRQQGVKLAIDIHADDPEQGRFRIHLTSRLRRWGLIDSTRDTPELDELRDLVVAELTPWVDGPCHFARVDKSDQ